MSKLKFRFTLIWNISENIVSKPVKKHLGYYLIKVSIVLYMQKSKKLEIFSKCVFRSLFSPPKNPILIQGHSVKIISDSF